MLPYIRSSIIALTTRFSSHQWVAMRASSLVPSFVVEKTFMDFSELIQQYETMLPGPLNAIEAEFDLYQSKWKQEKVENRPKTAIDAFRATNGHFMPNIKCLLHIFATLPVTTATAERSFSSLKLIKSYLRTTMQEERLNGLALMYIHSTIPIDVDEVIDKFAKQRQRKMDFAL
jgi:hypothetical protein